MSDSGITQEYLETILKEPIEKFEVSSGSNLGDGYTCAMYSANVWTTSQPENRLSLLVKCFPTNAGRQELLDQGGSFKIELETYRVIMPELVKFQEEAGIPQVIPLPIPKFINGQYISLEERKSLGRPFTPLDNYILMPDLRDKSNGTFRLRDRFLGFDLDHYRLVVEAQATLHALSWAYKCKRGVEDLEIKFPFLKVDHEPMMEMWQPYIESCFTESKKIIEDFPEAVAALERLYSLNASVGGLYWGVDMGQDLRRHTMDNILRIPGPVVENEEPWDVLLHGDAWSNNMLFRYDEKTNLPVEVILIDFQVCRQGNLFCDINYTLFASGTSELRQKHLTSMLHIYYDTFSNICDKLQVPTLPGWSWEEFNRRMHRSKIIGGVMAVMGLLLMLKNPDELENLDETAEKGTKPNALENAGEFFSNLTITQKPNSALKNRMLGVFLDLARDGIL